MNKINNKEQMNNVNRVQGHIDRLKDLELESMDNDELEKNKREIKNIRDHFSYQWEVINNEPDLKLEMMRYWDDVEKWRVINPKHQGEATEKYAELQHKNHKKELDQYEDYLEKEQQAYEEIDKIAEEKLTVINALLGDEQDE